jgi:DNA-binding transcriptional MerR regulator
MMDDTTEFAWTDARGCVTGPELCRLCGVTPAELEELVEYGLLKPVDGGGPRMFSADSVHPLRKANALRNCFELDLFVLGLMYSQLHLIQRLQRQVGSWQAQLPRALTEREGPACWREPHG